MEITKFKHACLVLTKNNQSLVIDPGEWSDDFVTPTNTVGVVITHEHGDHFDLMKLRDILHRNPETYIFAHVSVIAQLQDLTPQGTAVSPGDTRQAGEFTLHFTGGDHASIHRDYPVPPNIGILVDDGELYYPGDSFTLPGRPVETLAVPASAPWLCTADAMDFIASVRPAACFPTHNVLLSPLGHKLTNTWLEKAASTINAKLKILD